jgi:hypothetical protein
MLKDIGSATRKPVGTKAWIRLDDGFSVRPCRVLDLSGKGVRLMVDAPQDVASQFRLLMTRSAASGTRCRIKSRKGCEIVAEFVAAKARG